MAAASTGRDVPGLIALREELALQLDRQRSSVDDLRVLEDGLKAAAVEAATAAAALRQSRRDGAPNVARRAAELIRPLALAGRNCASRSNPDLYASGPIELDGNRCRLTGNGADLRLRARTTGARRPVKWGPIASGGERSRIWLGLSVLADRRRNARSTALREIDPGLGARTMRDRWRRSRPGWRRDAGDLHHPPATVAVKGERHWVKRKAARGRRTMLAVTEESGGRRAGGGAAARRQRCQRRPPAAQVAYARELLAKPGCSLATGN
ncbi:MAG: hypothetical protein IPH86_06275 [bacterium]|nr:hypothetical protein [bacterium]